MGEPGVPPWGRLLRDDGSITVVALGGNALTRPGERGTTEEQLANVRATCAALRPLFERDERLVVTHGNGPQVGNMLLRHERGAADAPAHPLWLLVAETQAEIGALLVSELSSVARRPAACILTRVTVDPGDPAFLEPTKPVGPSGGKPRRVVPSPRPLAVLEAKEIAAVLDSGAVPVCCGGGGIPVGPDSEGIDAVIDKDRTSAVLAGQIGAQRLLVLTDVPAVVRGFDTDDATELRNLDAAAAEKLLPALAAGSMRPKVEACADFVRTTGGEALITSAEALPDALAGRAGTRLAP